MLLATSMWGAVAIILPVALGVWVVYTIAQMIHHDSQGDVYRPRIPRIVPWSVTSRVRRTKAEVDLEDAKGELFDAKHKRLQKELVFQQLEDQRFKELMEGKINLSEPIPIERHAQRD